jgi:hypothetical protein
VGGGGYAGTRQRSQRKQPACGAKPRATGKQITKVICIRSS